MNKRLSWGVLSTANIGIGQVIPAMQQSSMLSVDAIASRNEDTARQAARKLGIGKAYGSYEAVTGGTAQEFPIEDAVANMAVIDAIFRSAISQSWERP